MRQPNECNLPETSFTSRLPNHITAASIRVVETQYVSLSLNVKYARMYSENRVWWLTVLPPLTILCLPVATLFPQTATPSTAAPAICRLVQPRSVVKRQGKTS